MPRRACPVEVGYTLSFVLRRLISPFLELRSWVFLETSEANLACAGDCAGAPSKPHLQRGGWKSSDSAVG